MPGVAWWGFFLEQNFDEAMRVVNTNITGTIYLIQEIARKMSDRRSGRILIAGSIAGFIPGSYQAVYNGTKAFLDNFSFALRAELEGSGVTVRCLMPGATETEFFERAGTKVGTAKKDDAADVARTGFQALMKGEGDVVTGWQNKLRLAIASVTPAGSASLRPAAHRCNRTSRSGLTRGTAPQDGATWFGGGLGTWHAAETWEWEWTRCLLENGVNISSKPERRVGKPSNGTRHSGSPNAKHHVGLLGNPASARR
jgi:short subunit dehydrogenase